MNTQILVKASFRLQTETSNHKHIIKITLQWKVSLYNEK